MKYAVVLCDGMADYKLDELGGKTPMMAAHKPNMDALAAHAEVGLVKTVDDGLAPGSDVANLSILGYDPKQYYFGRSPLEAVSMGIELQDTDVTLRCNLVTLSEHMPYAEKNFDIFSIFVFYEKVNFFAKHSTAVSLRIIVIIKAEHILFQFVVGSQINYLLIIADNKIFIPKN